MEEVRGSIPLSSTKSCEARPGGGFRAFRGLMPSGMNHPRASPYSKETAMDERLFEEFRFDWTLAGKFSHNVDGYITCLQLAVSV
jgi:hypothetical protein